MTGTPLGDRLAATEPTPEDRLVRDDWQKRTRAAIDEAMAELLPRERHIAHARWFIDDPMTLEELGQELGVSKERVRQLEARIVARLRERLRDLDEIPEDWLPQPS